MLKILINFYEYQFCMFNINLTRLYFVTEFYNLKFIGISKAEC